jgi:hypothetical protein
MKVIQSRTAGASSTQCNYRTDSRTKEDDSRDDGGRELILVHWCFHIANM